MPILLKRVVPLGIEGDRVVHVEDAKGRVITSRSHLRSLGHRGSLGTDGLLIMDGRPWDTPEVAAEIVAIAGLGARLVVSSPHFLVRADSRKRRGFQVICRLQKETGRTDC